jgi:hypothetical protein
MPCRIGAFAIVACVAIASCASRVPQDITAAWYPLQPADTWVYQKESRDGYMDHPSVERWTTEETITGAVTVSEPPGTLVAKRTQVLNHAVPPDFSAANDSTKSELPESHLLIYRSCVYLLDGADAQGAAWPVKLTASSACYADFISCT